MMTETERQNYQNLVKRIALCKDQNGSLWEKYMQEYPGMKTMELDISLYDYLYMYESISQACRFMKTELQELFTDIEKYPSFFYKILNREKCNETVKYITKLNIQKTFLRNLVLFYSGKEEYSFHDYEDIIIYFFRYSEGITSKELEEMDILDKYIDMVCFAMSYSGEPTSYGKAYKGGQFIRENSKWLHESILDKILLNNIDNVDYTIMNRYDMRYMLEMIVYSSLDDKVKRIFKFDYLDRYQLHVQLVNFFRGYFDNKYPESIYKEKASSGIIMNKEYQGRELQLIIDKNADRKELVYEFNELGKYTKLIVSYNVQDDNINIEYNNRIATLSFELDRMKRAYQETEVAFNDIFLSQTTKEYLELLFLYVDNLNQKGRQYKIPFSCEYQYRVEKQEKCCIYIEQEKKRIPNEFFQITRGTMGKIQNINALIGKNGSGKTSIARLLMESEIFGIKNEKDKNQYCLIFKSGKNLYWISNIENIEVETATEDTRVSKLDYKTGQFRSIMNTVVVAYNNILNPIDTGIFKNDVIKPFSSSERINLTTAEILSRDLGNNSQDDILRIANFYDDLNKTGKSFGTEPFDSIYMCMSLKTCRDIHDEFIKICNENKLNIDEVRTKIDFLDNIVDKSDIGEAYYKWSLQKYLYEKGSERYTVSEFDEVKDKLSIFYSRYKSLTSEAKRVDEDERGVRWKIKICEFCKWYDLFIEMMNDVKGFYFEIPKLSTGESARLLLFARLHSVFHVQDSYNKFLLLGLNQRNFILILDEIEAFFHPVWQREIIYDLIEFLEWESIEFNAYDNIHLILSSNSPFFLSDLPGDCLIYLDEASEKQMKDFTSFGQNIHTILKKSFLVKGLMGKFACEKIEKTFALLQDSSRKITEQDLEEIEYITNELQEPILKNALTELLLKREEYAKEQKKARYEEQIEKLKEKIKNL